MGGYKKQQMEEEGLYSLAISILEKIGATRTCEYHVDVYFNNGMPSGEMYAKATTEYKKQVGQSTGEFKKFHNKIKKALEGSYEYCPYCDKYFSD